MSVVAQAIRGTTSTKTAAAATEIRAKLFISGMGSRQACNHQISPGRTPTATVGGSFGRYSPGLGQA